MQKKDNNFDMQIHCLNIDNNNKTMGEENIVALKENTLYVVHLLGAAKEKVPIGDFKLPLIIIAATPYRKDLNIDEADFFLAKVSHNAFVSANIVTAEDKKKAALDINAWFTLRWNYIYGSDGNPVRNVSGFYRKKYTASLYKG